MINLIYKDFIVLKSSIKILLLYILIFSVAIGNGSAIASYFFLGVMLTFLTNSLIIAYDEKNKTENVLCSLPIRRNTIVLQKYFMVFLIFLISIIIAIVTVVLKYNIGMLNEFEMITPEMIIMIITILSFLYVFYYPLYFKFGDIKMRLIQFITVFAVIGVAQGVINVIDMIKFNNPEIINEPFIQSINNFMIALSTYPSYVLMGIVLLFDIGMLYLSYLISIRIYKNKDI